MNVLHLIDFLALAFVFGATAWFFFVQSPVLLKRMGREQFVPLQMRLTVVLFKVLTAALLLSVGVTALHSPLTSTAMATAAVAAFGGLVNQFIVVPKALRAGGRSRKDIAGRDDEGSTTGFASKGAGSATKRLHRTVVLFVVVMLGGIVSHAMTLLGG